RNILQDRHSRIPGFGYQPELSSKPAIRPMSETSGRYFLRFSAVDKPGVLGTIASRLGEDGISIAEMKQPALDTGDGVPVAVLTHHAQEGAIQSAVDAIDRMDVTVAKTKLLRIVEPA
ncbi:MAG: ACT domain-containing protein, partial [Myxococcales bacterium]|nr:ACT domain-containing protein [Myxococcales bacterium]